MDSRTGESITPYQANYAIYTWSLKNPIHVSIDLIRPAYMSEDQQIHFTVKFNHNLRKALHLHKCWITCRIWTSLTTSAASSLRSRIEFHLMNYLDSVGVISINYVIEAINNFVKKCAWVLEVEQIRTDVKMLLY
ncbi:C3 protein [Apple geminivirus]|nr:C3 protein [Apple geminivirus]QIV15583.1 C3 protein [Apple geminivirus]